MREIKRNKNETKKQTHSEEIRGLTLWTFRGRLAKPMEGYVATALHSFVGQSLL